MKTIAHFFPFARTGVVPRRRFLKSGLFVAMCACLFLLARAMADEVENVKEVEGFWGEVTGKVQSAQEDGRAFVLSVSKAEFDPATSVLKQNTPLIGKDLTIGVRMPKNSDGVASPHADDVAYIKTLKPGMMITVKIFAPRAHPRFLRIQGPGKSAGETTQPATK